MSATARREKSSPKISRRETLFKKPCLPAGWQLCDRHRERVEIARGFSLELAGLAAANAQGFTLTGSAGSPKVDPSPRAYYELLERILLWQASQEEKQANAQGFEQKDLQGKSLGRRLPQEKPLFPESPSPQSWQFAKSNGVACHRSWAEACMAAALELAERDLILRAWLGYSKPRLLPSPPAGHAFKELATLFDYVGVEFGQAKLAPWPDQVAKAIGCFLIPKSAELPLIYGFACHFDAKVALKKASEEACQRLGFLWGEGLPQTLPALQASALYHQDFFLMPENHFLIIKWLEGAWFSPAKAMAMPFLKLDFFDLSSSHFPTVQVVKASSPTAIPLVFGRCDRFAYASLSSERAIHPIV